MKKHTIITFDSNNYDAKCRMYDIRDQFMRIQILFDNIPDSETRTILKNHSFRWSSKNKAWQRQLTRNGNYALKQVLEELEVIK